MTSTFGRNFPKLGLDALEKRPAWWQDLLDARFTDASGKKRPLFLAVRDNYLNAYVEGQSISKIKFKAEKPPSVLRASIRASIHHKYVLEKAEGQKYSRFDGIKAGDVRYTGPKMLDGWIEKARCFAGEEKKGVAVIAANNPNVIDVEMGLPMGLRGHADRIDMVALERHGQAIRIVFYEAKCFKNSSLVSTTQPKVLDQLKRYTEWLKAEGRCKLLTDSYRRTCQILVTLRGMQKGQDMHRLISEAAGEQSILVVDPAPRLVIFGYDRSRLHPNWHGQHRPKLEEAGLRHNRLIIKPSSKEIKLPDGLGNDSFK